MKIFSRIIYGLFVGFVALVALFLVGTMIPIPGNFEVKIVQSGSMEPAIMTGAVVIVKPTDVYKVGDIITFGEDTSSEIPTTHRITALRVESGKFVFQTKGDANENIDGREVHEDAVIGKVLLNIPYIGFVIDFARQPLGFAVLVGIPALVVVTDEVHKIVIEARRLKAQRSTREEV